MSKEKKPIGHLVSDDKKVKIPIHGFGIYRTCLLPQKGKLLLNKPMPKQKQIEWEKRFEKIWGHHLKNTPMAQELKSFIHSLLKQERKTTIRLLKEALKRVDEESEEGEAFDSLLGSVENLIKLWKNKNK